MHIQGQIQVETLVGVGEEHVLYHNGFWGMQWAEGGIYFYIFCEALDCQYNRGRDELANQQHRSVILTFPLPLFFFLSGVGAVM